MSRAPQLLLDFGPPPAPSLDNFVTGRNHQLLALLRALPHLPLEQRFIHWWGDAGSGRSHLLRAAASAHQGRYLHSDSALQDFRFAEDTSVYAIDDVEHLPAAALSAVFQLINCCRDMQRGAVLSTSGRPPSALSLRDDVRSRLAWGLVFRLERLNDHETDAALSAYASARGLSLGPEVRRYLLTHCVRDLRYLNHLIDELDSYALAAHRPVTVPLLRRFIAEHEGSADGV